MAITETDFNLYLSTHHRQLPDKYYKVPASTVDTINANGGCAGLHCMMFKQHFIPMKEKGAEKTGKALGDLMPTDLNKIKGLTTKEAQEVVMGEYLA